MYSWDDPKDRVAIVQLNSELRHAELELLSAQCATDRLRLRFSPLDIARYAKREILRKAVDLASSLHHYYSSVGKQIPTNGVSDETVLIPARPKMNPLPSPVTVPSAGRRTDFGYSIVTKASPAVAWSVFIDLGRWPSYSDNYGEIRWVEGEPWQVGSRLLIEILRPVRVHIHHRITACVPLRRLGWIDHGLGTTIEQRVYFEPLPDGGTRVRTWAEFTGMARVIAGRPLRQILLDFTAKWYEHYRADCDRTADETGIR